MDACGGIRHCWRWSHESPRDVPRGCGGDAVDGVWEQEADLAACNSCISVDSCVVTSLGCHVNDSVNSLVKLRSHKRAIKRREARYYISTVFRLPLLGSR